MATIDTAISEYNNERLSILVTFKMHASGGANGINGFTQERAKQQQPLALNLII